MRLRKAQFRTRKGSVLLLTAFLMIFLMGVMAFAIDVGYITVARSQLQRTADSSAMAAAWELYEHATSDGDNILAKQEARASAAQFASANRVGSVSPGLANEDVTIGYRSNPFDLNSPIDTSHAHRPNTVSISVRRVTGQNGEVPLFFARALGRDSQAMQAEATAALVTNFIGFAAPGGGRNLGMLPFALDYDSWIEMLTYRSDDNWSWNGEGIESGADGVPEVNLYPQGTGSPGNRGTVDIGSSGNSTNDIKRQILEGVSPEDLAYHGGKLQLDENGELFLNADTGISAAVKAELEQVKGEGKIIPLFESVSGNGNNATYTITGFAGIRILEVKLTGKNKSKRVIIQPADVITGGGIVGESDTPTSYFIYSPVVLVH